MLKMFSQEFPTLSCYISTPPESEGPRPRVRHLRLLCGEFRERADPAAVLGGAAAACGPQDTHRPNIRRVEAF